MVSQILAIIAVLYLISLLRSGGGEGNDSDYLADDELDSRPRPDQEALTTPKDTEDAVLSNCSHIDDNFLATHKPEDSGAAEESGAPTQGRRDSRDPS